MKKLSPLMIAAAALLSLSTAPATSAPATTNGRSVTISDIGLERFELVYAAPRFTSRDEPERELLMSAAKLAIEHQQKFFSLLALPGEQGHVHPAQRVTPLGRRYGHWQPHWTITGAFGVEWWHPEWGREFWTKDVNPRDVTGVQVHAIVQLGPNPAAEASGLLFHAEAVVRDLGNLARVEKAHKGR